MSESHRAVVCRELGGEDALTIEAWPVAACEEKQIRVRTRAASVNFPDTLIIRGLYQMKPELPFVPGHELSGEVVEVGAGVDDFQPGDRVLSLCGFGAFAEQVVVAPPLHQLYRIPDAMPWDEAAGFNLTYGTAIHGLRQRGALREGESVLVLGAAGGCGSAAVEVAKAMGAKVFGAASSREKCAFVESLGADGVIDLGERELRAAVQELTEGRGVDLVFDPVGGDLFADAVRSLAWNGRLLVVGFAAGEIPQIAVNRTLLKSISIAGVAYGMSAIRDPAMNAENFRWLFDAYERGALRPRIDRRFAFEDTASALRHVRDRRVMGKVIIEIGD
jgi:NADPH2:quinone reductase